MRLYVLFFGTQKPLTGESVWVYNRSTFQATYSTEGYVKNVLIAAVLLFVMSVTSAIGAETPKPQPKHTEILPCEIGRAPFDPLRQWDPNTEFLVKSLEARAITMKFRKGDAVGESTCELPVGTILVGKLATGCVDAVYECFNTLVTPRDWCFPQYKRVAEAPASQDWNNPRREEIGSGGKRVMIINRPVIPRPGDPNTWFDFGKRPGERDLPVEVEIARDDNEPRLEETRREGRKLSRGAKAAIWIGGFVATGYACSRWDACTELFSGGDDPANEQRGPAQPPPP